MILFRLISWPYFRNHIGRSLLTVVGISIGVAVFVAMHAANDSVFGAFQQTVDRIAGATQLQVSAGEPGFDEDILERVQAHPNVKAAAPVVEAVVGTGLPGQGNLLILGVDMTGDRSLREYDFESGSEGVVDDPLVFLAQPDSIILTSDFAQRNGLTANSRIPLETANGPKEFIVRGILRAGGLGSAYGGNLAIMDVYATQFVFGRGRKFDRIDIGLSPNARVEEVAASLSKELGPGFEVQAPATRGQSFQSIQRIYYFMLNFSSAFALAVGMFIIYNSFSIAVTQRRSEIGILRALGASRSQIATLFFGESILAGLLGSILGITLGYAGASGLARALARILEGVNGVSPAALTIHLSPGFLALSAGIGTVTSVLAAFLPARAAARIDPVKALQKGRLQALSEGESRIRLRLAIVFAALATAPLIFTRSLTIFYAGYACIIIAVLLLTPQLVFGLTRVLRPLLCRFRPVEGALAADSLLAAPRRAAATVAALMLSLALVVGLAGSARASYSNIAGWVSTSLNADLFVATSQTITARNYKFPESMAEELERLPKVEQVQKLRSARISMQGDPVLLIVIETTKLAERSPRIVVEGSSRDMYDRVARGEAVLASENFASLRNKHLNDRVDIPSPSGVLHLPIAGVVREYSDLQGALMVDRAVFKKYWKDDAVDLFRVYLAKHTDAAAVKQDLLTRFSGNRRIFVLLNSEVRSYVMKLTNQWFALTWLQISIAILVATLGIVNSLTVSIADRRRELGILKAVGGLRQQIRYAIWMEAATLGLMSVILGLAIGAVHLYYVLELSARDYPGLRFDYTYPYSVAAMIVPIIIGASILAALGPGESAARERLVEALEYE